MFKYQCIAGNIQNSQVTLLLFPLRAVLYYDETHQTEHS